jgi:hypothetical protein
VSLRLKKFNLDEMNPLAVILAIGKRRENLLVEGPIIAPSPSLQVWSCRLRRWQQILRDFVPGCFIHEGFVEKTLDSYIQSHKAHREDETRTGSDGKSDIDPKKLFIMDDLGYDAPKWVKNMDIKFLHEWASYPYFVPLTLQYQKAFLPRRTNVDYTFIFRELNMNK